MITLFKSNETDFSHNGIGNLDYHIINPVVEEELNGLYSFTFRYPLFAPHGLKIEGESILRVPVPGMEDQLFRVYRHVKSMGYITVSCYHIFYDLADNFIEDTNIVEKNGQGAIQQLGGATQFNHNFRFFSDISTVANARLVRINVVASILDDEQGNSFVSRWGGELIRNNFDIRMNQSAGSNKGFTVKYRKNLTGYEADVDDSTVITRIMPKGFDGLLLPEKYIDSPLIDNYERPKIKMIDYNDVKAAIGEYADDEDAIPLEDAYAELRRLANEEYSIHKVDIPTVRYQVNFVTLDQTEEYKDLQDLQQLKMGDMATIDHEEDNFKVTAKLVKYRWDPIAKRYLSAELGSIHDGITTQFTDINAINRKVDEVIERTNIIQATADGKNTIYRGESEPVNPNLRDLWYKPNGAETEMYQFVDEGGQRFWKLIADTADTTSVRNDVDQALEDSQTAKNTADQSVATANLASQNAVEAINQAQDAFDDAQLALTTAQGLTNRMSSVEGDISTLSQTTQGFATRIENAEGDISTLTQTAQGLQTRVTDAEDNITSVTQLATGMQTRLTNAEGNINTLTQTATSLESTISSVRADLDGIEIGGRNLVPNSKDEISFTNTIYNHPLDVNLIKECIGEKLTISFYAKAAQSGQRMDVYLRDVTNASVISGARLNPFEVATEYTKYNYTISLADISSVTSLSLAFRSTVSAGGTVRGRVDIKHLQIEKGNKATDWTPAPEDMATQSQITQLSNNINLRVSKDDIINQINISTEDILISGKKLILDGDTTVTGTFRVANANITSVDAGKMTTGTLDAGQVNIINLNASNIVSGTIDTNLLTVRGGSAIDYTMIDGSYFESRGRFSRTWRGLTETHDIKLRFQNGYLQARNDSENHSLYFTDFGISTYADGAGDGASGTLAFRETEYSNALGVTLHSVGGVVALKSEQNRVVLDANQTVSIESKMASVYLRPMMDNRAGTNEFRFWVKNNPSYNDTDGVISYGTSDINSSSGLRFKKSIGGDPIVHITNGAGDVNSGKAQAISFLGDLEAQGTDGYIRVGNELRITDKNGYNGGNVTLKGLQARDVRVNSMRINSDSTHLYLGVSSGELRVSTNLLDNSNNPIYRPIRVGEVFIGTTGRIAIGNNITYVQSDGEVRATRYMSGTLVPMVAQAFNTSSSRSLKDNVELFTGSGLDVINDLTIVNYDWISDLDDGVYDNRQIGVISEDSSTIATKDGSGIKINDLVMYNAKATQELDAKIDLTREDLFLKVAQLEQRINQLEAS